MTIITPLDSEIKANKSISISITNKDMTAKFFGNLLNKSLRRREQATNLIDLFANSIKNDTIASPYKSCAQMLKDNDINPTDTSYAECFTLLKKLGIILKHNNVYLLNPLMEYNATARSFELAVQYYNLLFKQCVFSFSLKSIEDLKDEAVDNYIEDLVKQNQYKQQENELCKLAGIEPTQELLNIKSHEQYFNIAFGEKPKSQEGYKQFIWQKIQTIYRFISSDYITGLLLEHICMLEQQGVIDFQEGAQGRKSYFNFHKITVKSQMIFYYQTQRYLDSFTTPESKMKDASKFLSDIKDELQQQYEEEALNNMSRYVPAKKQYKSLSEETYDYSVLMQGMYPNEFPPVLPQIQKVCCTLPQYITLPELSEEEYILDVPLSSVNVPSTFNSPQQEQFYYKVWFLHKCFNMTGPEATEHFTEQQHFQFSRQYYTELKATPEFQADLIESKRITASILQERKQALQSNGTLRFNL